MNKNKKKEALLELTKLESRASALRKLIEEEENTTPKDITERVRTFEDACVVLDINPDDLWFIKVQGILPSYNLAYEKLRIISQALRENDIIDLYNTNQYKYYPYFDVRNTAFAFGLTDCAGCCTVVPSTLCQSTSEKAEYFGTQFIDLFKEYLTK